MAVLEKNDVFRRKEPLLVLFIFISTAASLSSFRNGSEPGKEIRHHVNNQTGRDELRGDHTFTKKLQMVARSISRNPFKIWFFKDRFKSPEDLLLTPQLYKSQLLQRNSTTDRLKEVIRRSLRGEDIAIAVLGGSISAGGGLTLDGEDLRGAYHRVFVDWWRKSVEPLTGSTAKLRNLSIGGTGSNFFAFCYKALLNPMATMDLALLDFTVNDYLQFKDGKLPAALSLEQLTREILSESNSPAVIFVNFVQGQSSRPICINLEDYGQNRLAINYEITTVSLRNLFCSNFSAGKKFPKMFASDGNHASILSHAQIAVMMINYVRNTMLDVIDALMKETNISHHDGHQLLSDGKVLLWSDCPLHVKGLPKFVFQESQHDFVERPLCFTRLTPDGTKNTSTSQSLEVTQIGHIGFREVMFVPVGNHKGLGLVPHTLPFKSRTDAYSGWEASRANSILQLEVIIPLILLADHCLLENISPVRNVVVAVRTHGNGGKARVWLNEYEERGIVINTLSLYGHTKLRTVARHVSPGRHVLSLRTSNNGTFTLSAVMVGPVF